MPISLCVRAADNSRICVREGNAKGKVIARVEVVVKNGDGPFQRDFRRQWMSLAVPLRSLPKGVADVVLTCEGPWVDVGWLRFKNRPKYFSPATQDAAHPDEQGYLRRCCCWNLFVRTSAPTLSSLTAICKRSLISNISKDR